MFPILSGLFIKGDNRWVVLANKTISVSLTCFMARSNLVTWVFLWEKVKTVDFSETIAASDLKVGRCRQLIEFMKVIEY